MAGIAGEWIFLGGLACTAWVAWEVADLVRRARLAGGATAHRAGGDRLTLRRDRRQGPRRAVDRRETPFDSRV